MRHASFDGFEVLIVIVVVLLILAAVGYAMCKVLGLDMKAFSKFNGTILVIVIAFLIVAQIMMFFFRA
jgi:hypothetical protein